MITANRYHDISCGHRVVGHEGKCKNLHGHNYRFHFSIEGTLDNVGRILDFGSIKIYLCEWLEKNWDHKMLIWDNDPWKENLLHLNPKGIVIVPFNPTAENMAQFFVRDLSPALLAATGCRLCELTIEETRKCSVTYKL